MSTGLSFDQLDHAAIINPPATPKDSPLSSSPDVKTKTLTVLNPWAVPLITGIKPFEFRRWRLPDRLIGVPIVLHAGTAAPSARLVTNLLTELRAGHTLTFGGADADAAIRYLEAGKWPSGAGLGLITFAEPRSAREAVDRDDVDPALFAWPVLERRPFRAPVAVRGQQGLWNWPADPLVAC